MLDPRPPLQIDPYSLSQQTGARTLCTSDISPRQTRTYNTQFARHHFALGLVSPVLEI